MRRLRLTRIAELEFDQLNYFGTRKYGPKQAEAYYRAIQTHLEFLVEHPFRYREREEIRPPLRLCTFGAHNIFYQVTDDELLIVRVLHHAIDWQNDL